MPVSSFAVPVIDESQVGDFHGGQLFSLADGQNLFVGQHGWQGIDPFDGFRFVVDAGRQARVNLSYTFNNLSPSEKQAWIWDLSTIPNGSGSCTPNGFLYSCLSIGSGQTRILSELFQSETGFVTPPNSTFGLLSQLTLGSGTYLISDNFGFDNLGASNSATGTFAYSIEIVQTPVPLPAPWIFILSGLPLLLSRRRTRAMPEFSSISSLKVLPKR